MPETRLDPHGRFTTGLLSKIVDMRTEFALDSGTGRHRNSWWEVRGALHAAVDFTMRYVDKYGDPSMVASDLLNRVPPQPPLTSPEQQRAWRVESRQIIADTFNRYR